MSGQIWHLGKFEPLFGHVCLDLGLLNLGFLHLEIQKLNWSYVLNEYDPKGWVFQKEWVSETRKWTEMLMYLVLEQDNLELRFFMQAFHHLIPLLCLPHQLTLDVNINVNEYIQLL